MFRALIQLCLRHRGVIVALGCVVAGYGAYTAVCAKLDVFPDFVQPQVVIQTEAPGLSPEQVEVLITRPIEAAVSGLGSTETIRSESIQGLSILTLVFEQGSSVFVARQLLSEKLVSVAGQLPLGAKPPKMSPLTSSTMDLLKIGLVSSKLSPLELRTFADWTLKPRLLAVPGVAKCSSYGGEVRQLQIQVSPDRLVAYDLALSDVLAAARQSTGVVGAGFVETASQRILIQTEGQALTPARLGEVVVLHRDGLSVRLKDLGRVVEGAEPRFGDALIQGRPGVLMTMSSQYGANTLEVTRALEAALAELAPALQQQGIELYPRLHRPATFIENALTNMRSSLFLGGALVVAVLFLLLGSVRAAFISLTAIPLSLLGAILVLDRLGVTLNTMTLGGLAIAVGEVVDDAIIDVENIVRRLRVNEALGRPRSSFEVVLDASLEVRSAVVYATFVVALVFLPVLTLTGLQGSFFAPLALSYILAILASLVVALTLTPALALLLFGRSLPRAREPRLQRWVRAGYRRLLAVLLHWPRVVVAAVLVICVAAIASIPTSGGELLPDFREGHYVVKLSLAPGSSLEESLRVGRQVSQALLRVDSIATVEQQAGRAEQGEDAWGPHLSEVHVELKPAGARDEEQTARAIRKTLEAIPGIQFEVLTFLGDRIGETISGETAPVVISIFGEELDALDRKAKEVVQVLGSVPGAQEVVWKSPPGTPRLAVKLKSDRLTQFGYRALDVLQAVQTAYQGAVVAQTYQGHRVSDVTVILDDEHRRDVESVGSLLLRSPQGLRLPLRELAEVYLTSGRHSILHEGARRRQTITCNPRGVDVRAFVARARRELARRVSWPAGTYVTFGGAAAAAEGAQRQLLLHSGIAAAGILLLLIIVFRNRHNLLLVLANVPFALVGGVLAAWASQLLAGEARHGLSIGALVGFVTLFGITMRNSIMMVSHFEHLVRIEGEAWSAETALRGASERLIPILMTALVTALGLLPLAIGTGEAGREIEGPMAIVILGGLCTSTVLNLLVLPTLALRYGRFAPAIDCPSRSVCV